jgi:hypothetical protein
MGAAPGIGNARSSQFTGTLNAFATDTSGAIFIGANRFDIPASTVSPAPPVGGNADNALCLAARCDMTHAVLRVTPKCGTHLKCGEHTIYPQIWDHKRVSSVLQTDQVDQCASTQFIRKYGITSVLLAHFTADWRIKLC